MSKSPSDFVSTFLESVGQKQDTDLYLRIFRELPKHSFAVVATEPLLMRHATGVVVEALRFLSELDLRITFTVGLLGDGGPNAATTAKKLRDGGVNCATIGVEDEAASRHVAQALEEESSVLIDLRGLPAEERGLRLGRLLRDLQTRKLVVLRSRGGLGPHRAGRLQLASGHSLLTRESGISVVNLTTDLGPLVRGQHLRRGESELLALLSGLHQSYPPLLTSVTSPFHLIQELFTIKGAGTLVKTGSTIQRFAAFERVDTKRLGELLHETFGRRLKSNLTKIPALSVYVEERYRGAAIVQQGEGAAYLSKFAVSKVAQGEGIGRDLWEALTSDYPALYWRADPKNPIIDWYARECDGMQRSTDWVVYWRGIGEALIPKVIEDARRRPHDFEVLVS